MTDKTTPDSEPTARKAFARQIITESPAVTVDGPPKPFQRRNIITTPDNEAAPPAPRPAFKPRNIL